MESRKRVITRFFWDSGTAGKDVQMSLEWWWGIGSRRTALRGEFKEAGRGFLFQQLTYRRKGKSNQLEICEILWAVLREL